MLTTNPGPHICPRCGERVSAFAAGCAPCGADLDPKRAQRHRNRPHFRTRRPVLPRREAMPARPALAGAIPHLR